MLPSNYALTSLCPWRVVGGASKAQSSSHSKHLPHIPEVSSADQDFEKTWSHTKQNSSWKACKKKQKRWFRLKQQRILLFLMQSTTQSSGDPRKVLAHFPFEKSRNGTQLSGCNGTAQCSLWTTRGTKISVSVDLIASTQWGQMCQD